MTRREFTASASEKEDDHDGADPLMKDKIFKDPTLPDPYKQSANVRDGAMAVLIGVAARESLDNGTPVAISDLTDLVSQATRPE